MSNAAAEVRNSLSGHLNEDEVDALVESILMWEGEEDGLLLSLCWGVTEHGLDVTIQHLFKFVLRSKKAAEVLDGTEYEEFFKMMTRIAESFLATIHMARPRKMN